jgi:hypothetical protein
MAIVRAILFTNGLLTAFDHTGAEDLRYRSYDPEVRDQLLRDYPGLKLERKVLDISTLNVLGDA